jgi:DNA-binding NarL/FixJ family response regulator
LERIRILLASVPHDFRDAFKDFVNGRHEFEVLGDLDESLGLLIAVEETQANVVVVGSQNAEWPGICSHLLGEFPQLKIVVLSPDGGEASLYELRPRPIFIRPVAIPALVEVMQAAVRNG